MLTDIAIIPRYYTLMETRVWRDHVRDREATRLCHLDVSGRQSSRHAIRSPPVTSNKQQRKVPGEANGLAHERDDLTSKHTRVHCDAFTDSGISWLAHTAHDVIQTCPTFSGRIDSIHLLLLIQEFKFFVDRFSIPLANPSTRIRTSKPYSYVDQSLLLFIH